MSTEGSISAQAISLWEELTGQRVTSTTYSFSVGGNSFDLHGANKRVEQAQKIGDDLAVALVIKTLSEQWAEAESYTLADYLSGGERLKARIDLFSRMTALFGGEVAVARFGSFFSYCEGALAHYRNVTVQQLDESSQAFVRHYGCFVGLDAVNSLNRLTRLMIKDGAVDRSAKAKVSRLVFAFESIDDLITHARRIPIGFSLCAILTPHVSDSYFVMVVNTGGRILALTDKGNYEHPLQEERMRTRNDRYNLNRISGSHFPYDLLNIKWGDNGRRASGGQTGNSLIVSDSGLRIVGELSDLNDWDLLWLHLFIDQCRDRYFEREGVEPQLATGSMIRLPHKWAEGADQLPVPAEFELRLDSKSSAELNTAFLHTLEPTWAERPNPNLWMEERFADQVPDDCLYVPDAALNAETPLLSHGEDGQRELARIDTSQMSSFAQGALPLLRLRGLSATALSTQERVIRDCHFIARHNQVQVIQRLVKEDYDARKDEMSRWFYDAAAKHLPNLIDDLLALNHERMFVTSPAHNEARAVLGMSEDSLKHSDDATVADFRTLRIEHRPVAQQRIPSRSHAVISLSSALKLIDYQFGYYLCAKDRSLEAQMVISLNISSVLDLITVTGLPIGRIPPELHRFGIETYVGNSILNRLDPLSHIRNPWDGMQFYYNVPVSWHCVKAALRSRGLTAPRIADMEAYADKSAKALREKVRQAQPPQAPIPDGMGGFLT